MTYHRPAPTAGRFQSFQPFSLRRLFFKGGGGGIDDTEDQKAMAQIAAERWDSYSEVFVPAENKYIDEMLNYDKQSRVENLEGTAAAGTKAAFDTAKQQELDSHTQSGVNPNSGVFNAAIDENTQRTAVSQTDAVVQTGQALQDQKVQGMKNVVAIGNGQAAETLAGMNNIASASAQRAIDDATTEAYRERSRDGAIGTVIGGGTRAALGYGDS